MAEVELVKTPPQKLSDVKISGGQIKSITLAIPLVSENAYLILKVPEEAISEIIKQAQKLPPDQRDQFIQNWLMQNQNVALQKYSEKKLRKFSFDMVPYRLVEAPRLPDKPINRLSSEETKGSGTKEDPFVASIAVSPFTRLSETGKTNVTLPFIIQLENVGSFYFKIQLKLGQLADDAISITGGSISFLLRKQIVDWATVHGIDTGTREFKSALSDAISNIAPNIREQAQKLKAKNPEWTDCLEGN